MAIITLGPAAPNFFDVPAIDLGPVLDATATTTSSSLWVYELYGGAVEVSFGGSNFIDFNFDDIPDFGTITSISIDASGSNVATISGFSLSILDVAFAVANDQSEDLLTDVFGGSNTFIGGSNADLVYGFTGNDLLVGNAGNDRLSADFGRDTLNGGLGADELDGGRGLDWASYEDASSGVIAILDTQYAIYNSGEAFGDTYIGIEGLIGSDHDDLLGGNSGLNGLDGGAGDDTLYGLGGTDYLIGGTGNDTLFGGNHIDGSGLGDDFFLFGTGDDADTINGFASGAGSEDVIILSLGLAFDTFAEIQSAASDVGGNTVLDFGSGDSITLIGVTSASLHQDDFSFA